MSKYGVSEAQRQRIESTFGRMEARADQMERYDLLRDQAKALAYTLAGETPPSLEQSEAMVHLQKFLFWANVAIHRNEKEPGF